MPSETSHEPYDPGRQQLGSVYAKALLGATEKAGQTDQVLGEFDSLLDDVLATLPRLQASLESPRIPMPARERLLDQAFGGRMNPLLLNFLKVVTRHGRMDCLRAIHSAAHYQFNQLRGRVAVEVRTAAPLEDDLRQQISNRLAAALGREVVLHCRVQPDLIGGIVVRVGDTVYDASVVNRLARIKELTVNRAADAIRDAIDRFAVAEPAGGEPAA
ncbi:MAG: ATP synthase F1 subunit delta [Pirellulaceae bacterium]|nr:ATP synthase F1 subunit delta [Pirellulaceae bacterium]